MLVSFLGVLSSLIVFFLLMRLLRPPVRFLGRLVLVGGLLMLFGGWMFSHIGTPFVAGGEMPSTS